MSAKIEVIAEVGRRSSFDARRELVGIAWSGEYRALREPEYIEQTWWFEAIEQARTIESLRAQGQRTIIHGIVQHESMQSRDFHLQAMRPGFDETWERFDEVLARAER